MNIKCRYCETELSLINKKYYDYLTCQNCGDHTERINSQTCCKQEKHEYVKHEIAHGNIQIRQQCSNCGNIQGRSYASSKFNLTSLSFSNRERHSNHLEETRKEWHDIQLNISNQKKLKKETLYRQYINSDAWKKRRKVVLERDNYKCQSCLVATAKEVHHLTYVHFTNEPLFDLISVCVDCHKAITDMDHNEVKFKTIKTPYS